MFSNSVSKSYLIHLRFACGATNYPVGCVHSQGENGEMGPEGAEGDRGEIGLNGEEGPPGHPGLIGVRVSTSAHSSKFNSLSTIRQLFVSIYNPVGFFFSSNRVRRVNLAKLEKEEDQEQRYDGSLNSGCNIANFEYLAVFTLVFWNGL